MSAAPALLGCAVEIAVTALHQSRGGMTIGHACKQVKICQDTIRSHPENCSAVVRPASGGYPVEIAVAPQDKAGSRKLPIRAAEGIEVREIAGGADSVDVPIAIRAALGGYAV